MKHAPPPIDFTDNATGSISNKVQILVYFSIITIIIRSGKHHSSSPPPPPTSSSISPKKYVKPSVESSLVVWIALFTSDQFPSAKDEEKRLVRTCGARWLIILLK